MMHISKAQDVTAFGEASKAIASMLDLHFLNQRHAEILQQANQDDPELAQWFILTMNDHVHKDATLSDNDFAGLCLMGMHRYDAHNGVIKTAPDHPDIQRLFHEFNSVTNGQDNHDAEIRTYLKKTPMSVGVTFAQRLWTSLRNKGRWDIAEFFKIRADAEKEYIEHNQIERQAISDIISNLSKGLTLNDLLRSSAANKSRR